jgi:PTH1 family peptidyl-tRNA hydrolase
MKIIIGLGNPGKEFENTGHNIGIFVLKNFTTSQKLNEFSLNKKLESKISENSNLNLFIPQKFMNESGIVVYKILKYFKVKPENMLIIHDDSDLMLGNYKIQFGRGTAGHKGIESITKLLKTKKFSRLRIGIRPVKENIRRKASDIVLKKLSEKQLEKIQEILPEIFKDIYYWIGNEQN